MDSVIVNLDKICSTYRTFGDFVDLNIPIKHHRTFSDDVTRAILSSILKSSGKITDDDLINDFVEDYSKKGENVWEKLKTQDKFKDEKLVNKIKLSTGLWRFFDYHFPIITEIQNNRKDSKINLNSVSDIALLDEKTWESTDNPTGSCTQGTSLLAEVRSETGWDAGTYSDAQILAAFSGSLVLILPDTAEFSHPSSLRYFVFRSLRVSLHVTFVVS